MTPLHTSVSFSSASSGTRQGLNNMKSEKEAKYFVDRGNCSESVMSSFPAGSY
jgi:hypothetical protein